MSIEGQLGYYSENTFVVTMTDAYCAIASHLLQPSKIEINHGSLTLMFSRLEEVQIEDNKEGVLVLLTSLKRNSIVIHPGTKVVYKQNDRLWFAPWHVLQVNIFPHSISDEGYEDNSKYFFSSMSKDIPRSLESRIFYKDMGTDSKRYRGFFSTSTRIAHKIQLSEFSHNRMKSYNDCLNNWSMDGDNQIWVTYCGKYIFKMVSDKVLYDHELLIYSKKLTCMPKLIDSWVYEQEYFLAFKFEGDSLTSMYHLAVLLPNDIKDKIEVVINELDSNGIIVGDGHMGNFVINNEGIIKAIDAEAMYFKKDKKIIEEIVASSNNQEHRKKLLLCIKSEESVDYLEYLLSVN